jgi:DNA/RNA endonuclease G (NUC1)
MTWGDLEDWILSQERSRGSRGSVFTGPIFQESDRVYEGVKVPVQFYKVVILIDDDKGQPSVTAFQMDQSSVMPPPPRAAEPRSTIRSRSLFGGPDNVVRLGGTPGP